MKSCFADDLFCTDHDDTHIKQTLNINNNLKIIYSWVFNWRVVFDSAKFKLINITYSDPIVNKNPCVNSLLGQWCSSHINQLYELTKQKLLYMKLQLQSSDLNVLSSDVCAIASEMSQHVSTILHTKTKNIDIQHIQQFKVLKHKTMNILQIQLKCSRTSKTRYPTSHTSQIPNIRVSNISILSNNNVFIVPSIQFPKKKKMKVNKHNRYQLEL